MDLKASNKKIIDLIVSDISFIVARFGIGPETFFSYTYYNNENCASLPYNNLNNIFRICGIYCNDNLNKKYIFDLYFQHVNKCIKNSDTLASFSGQLENIEEMYSKKYCIPRMDFKVLEPFYILETDYIPWTHYLIDKKVLIIHPFVDSFQKQLKNKFNIFKDKSKKVFLDDQKFVFYKTYQTHAYNHIHTSWLETFELMCNDIEKLDFDIALLGCGGYGLPLCNFIKSNLNKSAVYIGGGLQLLFGVMGNRWENFEYWKKTIAENDTKFIRPSGEEILKNKHIVENGSYW